MCKRIFYVIAALAMVISGCASNKSGDATPKQKKLPAVAVAEQSVKPTNESNTRVKANETVIVDWMGRTANAPSNPNWIVEVACNNYDNAAERLGRPTGTNIYRGLIIAGPDLRGAQMRADAEFARTIAKELHESINVFLASSASQSMNDATHEAIQERLQTRSEVEISGAKRVAEFWQNVVETDSVSGKQTRQTVLYRLFEFDRQDWAAITGGYVQKILNQLPQRQRPNEREVTSMLQNMLNDARHPIEMSQKERVAQLEAQQKMLDAQINLMPAQQRDAARIELAKINSETAITMGKQRADASVARTDAIAASNAERAAYASGSPILRTAASVVPADAAIIDAAQLAARILF